MSKFLELTGKICVVLFQIFLLIFVLPKVLKWKNRKIAKEYKENSEKNGEPKQKNSAFKNVMSRVSCGFFALFLPVYVQLHHLYAVKLLKLWQ